jgi:hypothetical protein
MGLAVTLSPSEMGAWAWYQSPVSPQAPAATQPSQAPTVAPALPAATLTSIPGTPPSVQTSSGGGRGRAVLTAGGIVLFGLLVGAVALLRRGQPPHEPTP